ncbi:MAG: hypothetical protein FH749_15710 [Firmicutes bacterium]|nr:hypothetical protein [Bacillota bacterium]
MFVLLSLNVAWAPYTHTHVGEVVGNQIYSMAAQRNAFREGSYQADLGREFLNVAYGIKTDSYAFSYTLAMLAGRNYASNTTAYAWAHGWFSHYYQDSRTSAVNDLYNKHPEKNWCSNPCGSLEPYLRAYGWMDGFVTVKKGTTKASTVYFNPSLIQQAYSTLGYSVPSQHTLVSEAGRIYVSMDLFLGPLHIQSCGTKWTSSQKSTLQTSLNKIYSVANISMPDPSGPLGFDDYTLDMSSIPFEAEDLFSESNALIIDYRTHTMTVAPGPEDGVYLTFTEKV